MSLEDRKTITRRARDKAKQLCFALFDSKCAVCGWTDERALQIDHKFRPIGPIYPRDRSKHLTGYRLYLRLVNGTEDKNMYQLLCANHNWIKRFQQQEFTTRTSTCPQGISQNKSTSHKD